MTYPVYDWLAHHAGRRPEKTALVDLASGRRFTYAEANGRAAALGSHLRDHLGVGKGDRVALLAENSTDMVEAVFACAKTGAIIVPLNWRLTVEELAFIVGDATPAVFIHESGFAETAAELQRRLGIPHLLETQGNGDDSAYERAIATGDKSLTVHDLRHDDPWFIMYTSGTTGLPKGAINTHGMNFFNCVNIGLPHLITSESVQLTVLPLFHTAGLNCYTNPVLHAGGTVLVMRTFDPAEALRLIGDRAVGVTHFFGVPANYQFMAQQPEFETTNLSRLVVAGVGGAPVSDAILTTWGARGVPIAQGYGMTETSPTVLILDAADALAKAGSTGKPAMHTAVRLVDEAGRDVAAGEIGELWVKGPNITPGYWNRPEETAAAITDGWLHTGDAARRDEDGFYTIVDRWKDMYISGGENVYPAEVENVLYQLPEIAEAAVVGVADEKWGEVGCAVLVLKPGATLPPERVIDHCRARLARFKLPKRVEYIAELPRNATGKVLKRELRARLAEADAQAAD